MIKKYYIAVLGELFCFFGGYKMDINEQLIQELKKLSPEGKISCTVARKLAEDLGVSPHKVGETCNELKIKVCACELGCFK